MFLKYIGKLSVFWVVIVIAMLVFGSVGLAETASEFAMHPYVDKVDGTTFMLPDGWNETTAPSADFPNIIASTQRSDSSRKVVFFYLCIDDWQNGQLYTSSRVEYDKMMNNAHIFSLNFGGAKVKEVVFNILGKVMNT